MTFTYEELLSETNKLKSFAFKLNRRSRADAADLLQATILRAIEKRGQFQEGTNLFSWTSKIMFNLFVTAYRRRTKFETQYDYEDVLKNKSVGPAQESGLEMKRLGAALKRLSTEHRLVLMMVCVQGMNYEDVSKKLSLPIGTVRSRLSRARAQIKYLMEEGIGDLDVMAADSRNESLLPAVSH
jgi:RNA polymerase sigma-70 factor, ECF subfamily